MGRCAHLDGTPVGRAKEDVLRLEVAVANVHLWQAQEGQRLEHLPRKLANEHEADALELGAPQEVIEVEGHVLKHQAGVPIVVKVVQEAHCVERVLLRCVCGVRRACV
jgi:hypothetical protein